MTIKGLGLAAVAVAALFEGTASAQEDLTRYPTDVMGSSNAANRARPRPEACNMKTASMLDYNILRVHNEARMCSAYSRDMYFEYSNGRGDFVDGLDEKNDPINYFRYHGIDIGPYEAALAALGFGQHDVRRRTGGVAFGARSAASARTAQQAPPVGPSATSAATDVGACGIAVSRVPGPAQAETAADGQCAFLHALLEYGHK